jgi:signal transduction histidine kinase
MGTIVTDAELEERIQALERELDGLPEPRSTWFLEPERASPERLASQIAIARESPVVDAVLRTGMGAAAVLNAQRQVVALNDRYLALLGVEDAGEVLGLRHGEAVRCVHGDATPGGCGTGVACRTCGAAISVLAAVESDAPAERDCALTVLREGTVVDAQLRIRAQRLDVPPERFILLSLTDVSADRRRASLERAVFHEMTDMLDAVVRACDAMDGASAEEAAIASFDARDVALRITHELRLQRALLAPVPGAVEPEPASVPLGGVLEMLALLLRHHPAAAGRHLRIGGAAMTTVVETDPYLLFRVLANLALNAFEASPPGGEVRLTVEPREAGLAFRVWNAGVIPPSVAPRIFQRYFTTRPGEGRGQGTFAARHFAERVLRGRLRFTSTVTEGTTFELQLPPTLRSGALTLMAL